MRRAGPLLAAAVVAGFAPSVHRLYPDGPPPAHTGGFGEPTCHACHQQTPINTGDGALEISGVPPAYRRDSTYILTIRVKRAALGAGGFQLSARFLDGEHTGRDAGVLRSVDDRTAVVRDDSTGISYAQHVEGGTMLTAPGLAEWSLEWSPPRRAGAPIAFHVAANAADGDASELGDLIYTAERMSGAAEAAPGHPRVSARNRSASAGPAASSSCLKNTNASSQS